MSVPVSILVPVKNEAANLKRSLPSVAWADEVFVVDSDSTDTTVAVAESFGAKVIPFEFNGVWPKKKNWALENLPFRHEWVFILDADEVLPPDAEAEFRAIVTDPEPPVDGYWINRRFLFMGRWMKHAYYPNWNLRLFRHAKGRYERLTAGATDSGDNEVHEHVVIEGETGRLKVEMDHYPFPDVATFIEKHNRYSNWEARVMLEFSGADGKGISAEEVRGRRRLKQLVRRLPFRPYLRFLWVYFGQLGFLDGREGYYFARLHAMYEAMSVMKAYELRKRK